MHIIITIHQNICNFRKDAMVYRYNNYSLFILFVDQMQTILTNNHWVLLYKPNIVKKVKYAGANKNKLPESLIWNVLETKVMFIRR